MEAMTSTSGINNAVTADCRLDMAAFSVSRHLVWKSACSTFVKLAHGFITRYGI